MALEEILLVNPRGKRRRTVKRRKRSAAKKASHPKRRVRRRANPKRHVRTRRSPIMARRKHRKARKSNPKRRRRHVTRRANPIRRRRRRRAVRRANPVRRRRRRRSNPGLAAMLNPTRRRRRRHRKHNPKRAHYRKRRYSNPFSTSGLMKLALPVAAGAFSIIGTDFLLSKVAPRFPVLGKPVVRAAATVGVALGLGYLVKKFLKKPQLAEAVTLVGAAVGVHALVSPYVTPLLGPGQAVTTAAAKAATAGTQTAMGLGLMDSLGSYSLVTGDEDLSALGAGDDDVGAGDELDEMEALAGDDDVGAMALVTSGEEL